MTEPASNKPLQLAPPQAPNKVLAVVATVLVLGFYGFVLCGLVDEFRHHVAGTPTFEMTKQEQKQLFTLQ
jgi:hypothetical protein